MDTGDQRTQNIKNEARRLGFSLVGLTSSEAPAHLDVFASWLDAGHHAEMAWMSTNRARECRANPQLILPECKTILVLGFAYAPSPPTPLPVREGRRGEGKIASYAQRQDYHDVLPPRLSALAEYIEAQCGHSIPHRWYTDTGPILERELAQRAGLGWIGKNSNLITPKAGSYFLLAEILLGVELPLDAPFISDHCGSCTRCVDACPTACILPNRTIDANRCISYLTIEHNGFIPLELRPKLGDWIFGCDICQQVCPWNQKFATPALYPHRLQSGQDQEWGATELILSPQEFNQKFEGTPIRRAKRRGYLRNVAITLGNLGNSQAVPDLTHALHDDEPLVRGHAAWALGQIGGEVAIAALSEAAQRENHPDVRGEIQSALAAQ